MLNWLGLCNRAGGDMPNSAQTDRKMNPLIDGYPTKSAVRITRSGRITVWGNDDSLRERSAIADIERAGIMINLLYIDRPPNDLAAWNGLLAYMRAGAEPTTEKDAGPRALDFDVDWMHILAGFRQAYGIDLNAHTLHYWEFTALLGGLPEECSLAKNYRIPDNDHRRRILSGKQKAILPARCAINTPPNTGQKTRAQKRCCIGNRCGDQGEMYVADAKVVIAAILNDKDVRSGLGTLGGLFGGLAGQAAGVGPALGSILPMITQIIPGLGGISSVGRGAARAAGGLGGAIGAIAGPAAIAVGAVAAIGSAVKYVGEALVTFATFEEAMSQLEATTFATAAQMDAMGDAAQQAGATTVFTATQAAEAMNHLAQAGYDSQTIIGLLPQTLLLAQAGAMGLAEATDMAVGQYQRAWVERAGSACIF